MGCIKCSSPHSNISPSFPFSPSTLQDFGPPLITFPLPPNEKSVRRCATIKTSDNHPVHNICVSLGEIPSSHPHLRYLRHIFVFILSHPPTTPNLLRM